VIGLDSVLRRLRAGLVSSGREVWLDSATASLFFLLFRAPPLDVVVLRRLVTERSPVEAALGAGSLSGC
jgi:hypothetical protein